MNQKDNVSEEEFQKRLATVRKLLARAEHANTPPAEAESCRTKAEALMFQYRIDEAMALSKSGYAGVSEGGLKPVWRTIVLTEGHGEFTNAYRAIAAMVMVHVDARGATRWNGEELEAEFVGFKSDLAYADVLLTACLLEFAKRLEPKHDPRMSFEDNVYNMRSAGMERKRITEILLGGWTTENEMKAKNRKVTNAFKKACEARGEDWQHLLGRNVNVKTYRTSYADGFVQQMRLRLMRMRAAHGEENNLPVLASRRELVDEAYYERFPHMRPRPSGEVWKDPRENCEKCKRAASGYCNEHRWLKPSTARPSERAFNINAYDRGGDAARAVDLGPRATGTPKAGHETRKEIG